jgi:hypothetical protein
MYDDSKSSISANSGYGNHERHYTTDMMTEDMDSFLQYMKDKLKMYGENVNTCYINIKEVIVLLEEEYPKIDISSTILLI